MEMQVQVWFRNRRQRVRLQGLRTDEDDSEEGEGEGAGGADEQREAYSQQVTVTSDAIAGNKAAFAPEVATETVAVDATVVEVLPESTHEESRRRRPKHFSEAVGGNLEEAPPSLGAPKQRKRTLERADSDPAAPSKNLTSVVDPKERLALQAFVQCIRTTHGSTGDDTGSDDTEAIVGPGELTVHRELSAAPDPLMNACVSFVISDLRDKEARRRKQRHCDSPVSEHSSTSTIPSLSGRSTETQVLSGHSGHSGISRGDSFSGRCSEVGLAVEAVGTAGGEADPMALTSEIHSEIHGVHGVATGPTAVTTAGMRFASSDGLRMHASSDGMTPCEFPATFEFPLEQYAPPRERRMEEPSNLSNLRDEIIPEIIPAARSVHVPESPYAGHLFGPPAGGHQQGEHVQAAMMMAELQDATRRAEEVMRALQVHSPKAHTAAHEVMSGAVTGAAHAAEATFVPVGGGHPMTCLNRMVSENGTVNWAPAHWPFAGSMPMPNGSMQLQQHLAMSQNAYQMLPSAMANTQSGFATSMPNWNLLSRLLYPPQLGAAAYTGFPQFSIPCYTMPPTSSAGSAHRYAHRGEVHSSMPDMTSRCHLDVISMPETTPAPSAPSTSQDPAFWAVLDALLN